MDLGHSGHGLAVRATVRWLALTAAVALAASALSPVLVGPAGPVTGFEAALGRVCTVALLVSLAWLWVVATVVAVDALRGRVRARRGVPEDLRRILLGACGLALAGGVASAPAYAGTPEAHHPRQGIAGLPLPDRATAVSRIAWLVAHPEHRAHPRPEPSPRREARVCVVRHGDSLWALATEALGPGADDAAVDDAWRRLYRTNRAALGPDPDLIRPGQRLLVPDRLRGGTT